MSPKLFCAECGKTETPLFQNLCPDCYFKNSKPIKIKTPLTNKICINCYATQRSHRWIIERKRKTTLEELLWRAAYIAVDDAIQIRHPWNVAPLQDQLFIEITPQITEEVLIEKKRKFLVPVRIVLSWNPEYPVQVLKRTLETIVEIDSVLCNICSQAKRGYAEATIQVRFPKNLKRSLRLEKQRMIVEEILKYVEKNPASAITDQTQQSNGIDLSFNQKAIAHTISNLLKKRYKAVIKKSFKQMYFKHGEHLKKLVISATIK